MKDEAESDITKYLVKKGVLTQKQVDEAKEELESLAAEPTVHVEPPKPLSAGEPPQKTGIAASPPTPEEMERYRLRLGLAPSPELEKTKAGIQVQGAAARPLGASTGDLPPGRRFGDYTIMKEIGRGGMGIVYEAVHTSLGRRAALKILPWDQEEDEAFVERFEREARAAAKLKHPNIVQVYESGVQDGRRYISMELVEGKSLHEVMGKEEIAPRRAATLVIAAAEALAFSHAAGVIHRDVKPHNIMVGAGDHVYLMDFGLALDMGVTGMTATGTVLGTLAYMPPEQANGERVDAQADVYSLGATLYHLLTGQAPFSGADWKSIHKKILYSEPQRMQKLMAAVPKDLETITLKALEKPKGRRYATMEAFKADLVRWRDGEPIEARPASIAEKLRRKVRKNRAATALGAMVVVVLAVALGAWWRDRSNKWARANALVTQFGKEHMVGDPNSAYERLSQASALVGEFPELSKTRSNARLADLEEAITKLGVDLEKWKAAVSEAERTAALEKGAVDPKEWLVASSDLALLKEADGEQGPHAKEIALLDRLVKGSGTLEIHTDPEGASFTLYDFNEKGLWDVQQDSKKWTLLEGKTPLAKRPFEMGQYLIIFHLDDYADTNYPIWIERNGDERPSVRLLHLEQVPKGMVYVPAGDVRVDEIPPRPRRVMHVPGFLIGAKEITQAEYSLVLSGVGDEGRQHTPLDDNGGQIWTDRGPPRGWESLPVFGVTYEDARFFARRVDARLPTFEEFVRAGLGAGGRRFPWGNRWEPERVACRASVVSAVHATELLFERGATPFGCYNLLGNVSEWITAVREGAGGLCAAAGGSYTDSAEQQFELCGNPVSATKMRARSIGFRIARDPRP